MSKRERKEALEFILNNEVIVKRLSTAIGCDKGMTIKERRVIVKDMIKSYYRDNVTDSFSLNVFGPGKRNKAGIFSDRGFRDDRFDDIDSFDFDDGPNMSKDIRDRIILK